MPDVAAKRLLQTPMHTTQPTLRQLRLAGRQHSCCTAGLPPPPVVCCWCLALLCCCLQGRQVGGRGRHMPDPSGVWGAGRKGLQGTQDLHAGKGEDGAPSGGQPLAAVPCENCTFEPQQGWQSKRQAEQCHSAAAYPRSAPPSPHLA